ncbi:MAG: hypothetical protein WBA23_09220 [Tunicatimonas sp.]|uniref:hypothetical protein n=1 Tax=Tunicatimonas sp. TaxID=1940096 RepID=UPI003C734E6B
MHTANKTTETFRPATTLTEFLRAAQVIIYNEADTDQVRKRGKGSDIKQEAIRQVLKANTTYTDAEAERRVEQRLIYLCGKRLIFIRT